MARFDDWTRFTVRRLMRPSIDADSSGGADQSLVLTSLAFPATDQQVGRRGQISSRQSESHSSLWVWKEFATSWGAQIVEDAFDIAYPSRQRGTQKMPQNSRGTVNAKNRVSEA